MTKAAVAFSVVFSVVTIAAAQDTKKTCLVAAEIRAPGLAPMEEALVTVSSGKSMSATPISRGLSHGGGFFLKDVPEGEFRVTNVRYRSTVRASGPDKAGMRFDTLGIASAGSDRGDIANELSGTCKGGFIWLGSFVVDPGSLVAAPTMTLGNNEVTAENARGEVKSQLKGTAWEAEIDKPVANAPLAKGKNVEGKLDAETASKAVAAVAAQTRNAKAPPSDDGAIEAAVGTWTLMTINDKPLPAPLKASPCSFHNAWMTVKDDASYTADLLMECNGQKFPLPTAGFIGIKGGVVTYAPTKGPPANPAQKTTVAGDTLTSTAGPDTYVYKKK